MEVPGRTIRSKRDTGLDFESQPRQTTNEEAHMYKTSRRGGRRARPLSGHRLLDKSYTAKQSVVELKSCKEHRTVPIEYYCNKTDQLFCRECLHWCHKRCQYDELISMVCSNVEENKEYKVLYRGLTEIQQKVQRKETEVCTEANDMIARRTKIRKDIDAFGKELHQYVTKLVDDMHKELNDSTDTDKIKIKNLNGDCKTIASEVKDLLNEMDMGRQSQDRQQLFIMMKLAQEAKEELENKLMKIDAQSKVAKCRLVRSKQIEDTIRSVQKLGQLSSNCAEERQSAADTGCMAVGSPNASERNLVKEDTPKRNLIREEVPKLYLNKMESKKEQTLTSACVSAAGGANVMSVVAGSEEVQRPPVNLERIVISNTTKLAAKLDRDQYDCNISGIVMMGPDWLVMTDYGNSSLKVLRLQWKQTRQVAKFAFSPDDVAKIDNNTVAILFRDKPYIELETVSLHGDAYLRKTIPTQGPCCSLRYINTPEGGKMIVGLSDPGRVQVIAMSQKVLKDLSTDDDGTPLFEYPWYITLSKDSSVIYVSDPNMNKLTAMTIEGKVKFTYRDAKLQGAAGIAVGDDGEIFVCGALSNNIHLLSSHGRKIKMFPLMNDEVKTTFGAILSSALQDMFGVIRGPKAVAYDSNDRKLYVGMRSNNSVHVLTMSQEQMPDYGCLSRKYYW